jgi:hypothetical protein
VQSRVAARRRHPASRSYPIFRGKPANTNAHVYVGARAKIRAMQHDWFANLMGFSEGSYEWTRSRLVVEGDELVSTVNGNRYGIGILSLPTLAKLRVQVDFPEGRWPNMQHLSSNLGPPNYGNANNLEKRHGLPVSNDLTSEHVDDARFTETGHPTQISLPVLPCRCRRP